MNNLRIKFEEINVTCAKSTGSCFINNEISVNNLGDRFLAASLDFFWQLLTLMSDCRAESVRLLYESAGSR